MPATTNLRAVCTGPAKTGADFPGNFVVEESGSPRLTRPDGVLAEPRLATICLTDIKIATGHFARASLPRVLGHEGCVRILKVGPEANRLRARHRLGPLKEGQFAAMDPNIVCLRPDCPFCSRRETNFCPKMKAIGVDLDGLFQQRVAIPALQLDPVPEEVAHVASFQELLACALHGYKKVRVLPGDRVIILGAGASAMMQLLLIRRHRPSKIVVADLQRSRLNVARKLGATQTVQVRRDDSLDDAFDRIHRACPEADVVIEAAGASDTITLALMGRRRGDGVRMLARKGGQVLLFGINDAELSGLSQETWYLYGATMRASFIYTRDDFLEARSLLSDFKEQLPLLISDPYPLTTEGVCEGFGRAVAGEVLGRVAIVPNG
ncbi:MAG: zinc-binding dehydrogenase [Armatimonadota bacterium]